MKLKAWHQISESKGYQSAQMPPNEIYHCADFMRDENKQNGIFRKFWTYVGHTSQFSGDGEGKYITGMLGCNLPITIIQNQENKYQGFVNVCRHRAAILLKKSGAEDSGGCGFFGKHISCPYHGWQYSADGRLAKALKMKGVQEFSAKQHSLFPIQIEVLGHLLFARVPNSSEHKEPTHKESSQSLDQGSFDCQFPGLRERFSDLTGGGYRFVGRHSYEINCNWKIFADNYLDGGYHIHAVHPGLASQLNLNSYKVELFPNYSIQQCEVPAKPVLVGREVSKRVGPPTYAWLFPATAINLYGDWIDVHVVYPLAPNRCRVSFDYFLKDQRMQSMPAAELAASKAASHDVQMEDVGICEMVQQGLESDGYRPGRYAAPESASFHFHQTLARNI